MYIEKKKHFFLGSSLFFKCFNLRSVGCNESSLYTCMWVSLFKHKYIDDKVKFFTNDLVQCVHALCIFLKRNAFFMHIFTVLLCYMFYNNYTCTSLYLSSFTWPKTLYFYIVTQLLGKHYYFDNLHYSIYWHTSPWKIELWLTSFHLLYLTIGYWGNPSLYGAISEVKQMTDTFLYYNRYAKFQESLMDKYTCRHLCHTLFGLVRLFFLDDRFTLMKATWEYTLTYSRGRLDSKSLILKVNIKYIYRIQTSCSDY